MSSDQFDFRDLADREILIIIAERQHEDRTRLNVAEKRISSLDKWRWITTGGLTLLAGLLKWRE